MDLVFGELQHVSKVILSMVLLFTCQT